MIFFQNILQTFYFLDSIVFLRNFSQSLIVFFLVLYVLIFLLQICYSSYDFHTLFVVLLLMLSFEITLILLLLLPKSRFLTRFYSFCYVMFLTLFQNLLSPDVLFFLRKVPRFTSSFDFISSKFISVFAQKGRRYLLFFHFHMFFVNKRVLQRFCTRTLFLQNIENFSIGGKRF